MSKSQSWIKDRIGVWLIGLLICSLVLAIAGFAASSEPRRKLAAFASDGQTVIGTITNKSIQGASWNQAHRFDVTFSTQDGKTHRESTNVANTMYDAVQVGSP